MSENSTTVEQTFNIPVCNFPSFELEMGKLAKRAAKLGSANVGFEVLRTFKVRGERIGKDLNEKGEWVEIFRYRTFKEVRVFGPRPKFEGWTLMGRLDFATAPGSCLRMMVPGETCPEAFHGVEADRCDHCHSRRFRNDTFLVRHDDGRILVVGRQCIGDFLGQASPEHIANMCSFLAEVRAMGEESESYCGPRGIEGWEPTEVLAFATSMIRTDGWLSSAGGGINCRSTKSDVLDLLTPKSPDQWGYAEWKARLELVSAHDHAMGEKALAWVLEQNADTDYMHNLKAICQSWVTYKSIGIAVSAVVAYNRAMEREVARKRAAQRPPSKHVGSVKEKLSFTAECLGSRSVESQWGSTTICRFADADGNIFVWFASNAPELETGVHYQIKGTVKKHDDYKGTKQTVLTRCKLTAVETA